MNIFLWIIGGLALFLLIGTGMFYYLIIQAMKTSSQQEGWLIKLIMPFMRLYALLMSVFMMFAPNNFKKSIKKILP